MLLFSIIILAVYIFSKKIMAHLLDSTVEHEIWFWQRFGFKKQHKLKTPVPAGIILPLFITVFSLGFAKFLTLMTFETRALKHRAARRFGFYSFAQMTDWHQALIGAAGILSLLILGAIAYFLPFSNLEFLAKISIYYAFWNLLPISKLDGTQIFFGSRILYAALAIITLIATAFAILIA
tara:strand:+ start:3720 stop:4259 length:540 start_codon:yes stop_codon:yes gene_type:complete